MSHDELSSNTPVEFTHPGDLNVGPGAYLRRARERMNLTISDVANSLHLTGQLISDIENDDYSHVAGITFARGYLRAYSRLLCISENEIIEEFEQLEKPEHFQEKALHTTSQVEQTADSRDGVLFRYVRYLILLIIFVMIGLWWHAQQNALISPAQLAQSEQTESEPLQADGSDALTTNDQDRTSLLSSFQPAVPKQLINISLL